MTNVIGKFGVAVLGATMWLASVPETGSAPAEPLRISPPGGVYTEAVTVRMEAGQGIIRFTRDGSDPGEASPAYREPIELPDGGVLKARLFGGPPGSTSVVAQVYAVLDPGLREFDSNLPLVVLDTLGQRVDNVNRVPAALLVVDGGTNRAALASAVEFAGLASIRVRGHSSLRYPKRSYSLKTVDGAGAALKRSLLGLPKDNEWVLYAPYPDKSLMRDVLAYEMARLMGYWAARTRFCEVFVNDSGGRLHRRHYMGVYVFEEKVKRAEHRVHIAALKPEHDQEPEITGGYIFKKDHFDQGFMMEDNLLGVPPFRGSSSRSFFSGPGGFPADPAGFLPERGAPDEGRGGREGARRGGGLESMMRELFFRNSGGPAQRGEPRGAPETFSTRSGQTFFYVEPEPDEITLAQRRWLVEHLNRLEEVLNGADFRDPDRGYRAFLDVDSFIDQHLMVEVTKNIDGFRFSAFYHKDRGGKIRMQPVWDWNLSFGNANGKQGWLSKYWYWPQLDDRQYTWFRRLFEDPDFAQRYVDRYFELRTNVFSPARLEARMDELASLLEEAQVRNFRRWPILDQKVWPNYFVFDTYAEEIRFLKSWTRDRIAWIDAQFVAPPAVVSRDSGSGVTLRAGAGSIYYVLDGSDPRAPGGGVAKAARICEGAVLAAKGTRLVARVKVGERWSAPLAMTL